MTEKPFEFIQSMTRQHRVDHGCGAYTFEDGPGLTALAATHRASRVLELGTALGYTGCCLAAATPNTHVDTIERDIEHVRLARENIAKAELSDRVRVHKRIQGLLHLALMCGPPCLYNCGRLTPGENPEPSPDSAVPVFVPHKAKKGHKTAHLDKWVTGL